MRLYSRIRLFFGLTLFFSVGRIIWWNLGTKPVHILPNTNRSIEMVPGLTNHTPAILMWTLKGHINYSVNWTEGHGYLKKFRCPVNNCIFTTDQSRYKEVDAVVFHMLDFHIERTPPPPERLSRQRYIFFNRESPLQPWIKEVTHSAWINGFFNWTMTTRMDSDIPAPYFTFKEVKTPIRHHLFDVVRGKDKMVAWFVSHCHTDSNRELYVEELSKYISVDVYGKCGTARLTPRWDLSVYRKLNKYWFYLSFENSICKDYATEKLNFPMQFSKVLPIVLGGFNYTKYLPEYSYIDVMDFPSPRALASYLQWLVKNPRQYMQYFEWRGKYKILYAPPPWCRLCKLLNELGQEEKIYTNLTNWWNENQCDLQWVERTSRLWDETKKPSFIANQH